MSLEALHAEVDGYRTEAGQLAEEFPRAHAEIADDPHLTRPPASGSASNRSTPKSPSR